MQGLMVVGLIVEEILNVDVKCVKGTGTQNIGQRTDEWKSGHLCHKVRRTGRYFIQGLMVV